MANIELVIKIPEEKYDVIKSDLYNTFPADMRAWGLEAIRNGTPLPKGHGGLLDITFVIQAKITRDNNGISDRTKGWNEACQAIFENAPIIIPEDK